MTDYYDDLLKLCGFEEEEINAERPRVEKSFKRLGIGPEDMEPSERWVRQNHDVTLTGVRKLLGAWLKELIDVVLAKDEGKKVVYFGFPAIAGPGLMIAASSKDVFVTAPDMVLCHTMGQIFNKLVPIIEAGEANGLPPGHALCSLWQVKIGGVVKGMVPVPDLALASSYFCDMGSKADDFVTAKFGVPIAYIDGSMDSFWGEYPEYLPERVTYLGTQINQTLAKAEKVLGIKIAPDAWEKSQQGTQAFVSRLLKLIELMKADPVPVTMSALELLEALSVASTGRGIQEGVKAMEILIHELEERVKAGIGATKKGAPRVMILGGHMSDPRILRMIEDVGLAIPLSLILSIVAGPPTKSTVAYATPGETIAADEMATGMNHGTDAAIKRIEMGTKVMKLDGSIMNYLYNCRPAALQSHNAKKYLEEKTGLPVLSLEYDMYDSRTYSAASMRTKVETFAEILKARKTSHA